jgi:hypothetical protein
VIGFGTIFLLLSLFVDVDVVKESTVLSIGQGETFTGFYLDGNKNFEAFVTVTGYPRDLDLEVYKPTYSTIDKIGLEFVSERYYKFIFSTTDSGIYNFYAKTDQPNRWITFAVKEQAVTPAFVPPFYAQVLSFAGGGLIGFIIPIIHQRYKDAKTASIR